MTNLFEEHARELAGKGPDWSVYAWRVIDNSVLYTGGVPHLLTRGKRKGQRAWGKKCDQTTIATVAITDAAHKEWVAAWAVRTGGCVPCEGNGKTFARWTKEGGAEFKYCLACGGTGKAVPT